METMPRSGPTRGRALFLLFWLLGGALLIFILLPLVAMFSQESAKTVVRVAAMPDVRASILLSLEAALLSAGIAALLGTPLAYLLAHREFPLKSLVEGIVDLPLAVPHTVAGIALLYAFGRTGLLGRLAAQVGLKFWGTLAGVVVGMLFVSLPYMVNSAREGFQGVDVRLEKAARTLGASPSQVFWQVSLPLAGRSILSGTVLTYARSVAEFGAVIILAYYPQTAPVKIYELFLAGNLGQSAAAALLLLLITLSTFLLFRRLVYARVWKRGR
ncbi:Binding-protein-dependent transport system inner membrane component [Acididesulfobacillus acetoxydans]|uniref:Binding-protein-dependent transport system inner membrane component n=2 Tax=Acididesulfobacillus acetoxydans TaxID=1561005 RepID=A0A8S0WXQ0_9FIRM|nr:Binding-protein-dependent transport system inner membrane component [Acididesulfobacillus acetoxydans]CEJ06965.1 Molybdate/tungstate transport system permease protein WtpB [Acididesulfobacillus acetoxydans]